MAETFDLILRGGVIVNQDGIAEGDIAVRNGRIADIGSFRSNLAAEVLDLAGLHVLPGVIDSQVHFREPGNEHKEDLNTGSRAAVKGGVTAVFEMPNTVPPTVEEASLEDKLGRAREGMFCDFAFWVGGTRDNIDRLAELERLPGACGIKVFMGSSTGSLLVPDDESVERILAATSRRVAFHSEDEFRLRERLAERRENEPQTHTDWRDVQTALQATTRLVALARRTGRRIHILHVSTAEEMLMLAGYRDVATVEVTPQHLTLAAPEAYRRLGTLAQMNPPIREAHHREALWWGVVAGVADVIGSDHAPHTLAEKGEPYPKSPSGMPSVQTLVPVMLDHVNAGRLSLERLVDLTSHGPARVFQIAGKGRIAAGYDADFTIVDLGRRVSISNAWIESRCGWTPFAGTEVAGWPVGTIIRGRRVMWEDEIIGEPGGEPVRFLETLSPVAEPVPAEA